MKKLRNKNKFQSGFTLIELLVVIAIIGLLASVVLLALNSARAKSRDAKRLADVRQMASALELFFNDRSSYPTVGFNTTLANITTANMTSAGLIPAYMGIAPTAPNPPDNVSGSACSATTNPYRYALPIAPDTSTNASLGSYTLTFCLGDTTGGYAAGIHTLTPAGIQ